jgi:8-oxo-dGTP diphosphatase
MSGLMKEIALGIVRCNDQVLLIERRRKEQGLNNESLNWVFPGGQIDPGETPNSAAEREVYEETGYTVEAARVLDQLQHPTFPAYVYYIACNLTNIAPNIIDDSGVVQAQWVQISKLGSFVTSSLNEKVIDYLTK